MKLYFTHYSCVVIILLSTGLYTLHKKWIFPLRIFSAKVMKSETADLVIFIEELHNGKLHFLYSDKFAFSADSFRKLIFSVSVLFGLCRIRCNLCKIYNIFLMIVYIGWVLGTLCFCSHLFLKGDNASQTFEYRQLLIIKNMFLGSFWAYKS